MPINSDQFTRRPDRFTSSTTTKQLAGYGTNPTNCVAYHPSIAVLPFVPALSVCYCKRTLLCGGQLWPDVRMGSLGTSAKCELVRKPHAGFGNHKAFHISYSSFLQSHDSLPHNMACSI